MNRDALRRVVEQTDTAAGRRFDLTFQLLIIIAIVSFSIETLPNLSGRVRDLLWWIEIVTVVIFTAEYLLRLWVAERRLRFATSFFGVVDLLAVLPFLLATGVDLRGIRAFRLLRLFRVFKLLRYSRGDLEIPPGLDARSRRAGFVCRARSTRALRLRGGHLLLREPGPARRVRLHLSQPLVGGRDFDDGWLR